MKIDLNTVHINSLSFDRTRASIGATTDEGRMHYWCSFPGMVPEGDRLYVNDRPGAKRTNGYGSTTQRSLSSVGGKRFRTTCEGIIATRGLREKLVADADAQRAAEEAEQLVKQAEYRQQMAGPEMYVAAKALFAVLTQIGASATPQVWDAVGELRRAVKLAETGTERDRL